MSTQWINPVVLDNLEKQRDAKRERLGRLSFDCYNLKVTPSGERVYCSKWKTLGSAKDGTLSLLSILRGLTSGVCKNCDGFEGG